jgi:hypothetical protein
MKKYLYLFLLILLCVDAYSQRQKHLEKPKLMGIPIIGYNKSFGWKFGAFGAVYYPINKKDTISPPSMSGAGAMITTNGTWCAFGFTSMYYKEDLWRTQIAVGHSNQNFQFFNENFGSGGSFMAYNTVADFVYAEQMINVYKRWYTGLDATWFNVNTTVDAPIPTQVRNYVAMGIPLTQDSRDNVQNPSSGSFANCRLNRFSKALGSYSEYTKLDLDVSKYFGKSPKKVFACKASVSTALGTVPFEAQTVVGGRVLRGYSDGKYRGDQVYALQGEYRWNFYKRLGAVFFGGVATPVTEGTQWDASYILPAAGTGIRYMMIEEIRANIGFDIALGKQDYGIYIRFAEAF